MSAPPSGFPPIPNQPPGPIDCVIRTVNGVAIISIAGVDYPLTAVAAAWPAPQATESAQEKGPENGAS